MKAVFSVVIPVFNEEKTIGKILGNLKKLSSNYNTEIIVIDSQSTDRTVEIIKSYQKKIARLRLFKIKRKDFNHSRVRNFAVKKAQGDFILFLSGDAIPKGGNILKYLLEDFRLEKKVVAVFGQQVPYQDTSVFQKLEILCRFDELNKLTNKKGVLIQNLKKPFIPFNQDNKSLWYFLSNVFACYRRSFLVKYPFPKTNYGEDLLMGRLIIEKGYIKVYDRRISVTHSHRLSLSQYFRMQQVDFSLRFSRLNFKAKPKIVCKLKKMFEMDVSFLRKIYYLFELFFYYLIKTFIITTSAFRKRSLQEIKDPRREKELKKNGR